MKPIPETGDRPIWMAFRRRCGWCGVQLRWWQMNLCHTCHVYVENIMTGPPCPAGSRWHKRPDLLGGKP